MAEAGQKGTGAKAPFAVSVAAVLALSVLSILLCWFVYASSERSFYQSTVDHSLNTMEVVRELGIESVDTRIRSVKTDVQSQATANATKLLAAVAEGPTALGDVLSSFERSEYGQDFWFLAPDGTLTGSDGQTPPWAEVMPPADTAALLAATDSQLFSPAYNNQRSYVMAVAAPVAVDGEFVGVLVERFDGYCVSYWIARLTFEAGDGAAYLVDGTGRNIAASRPENYEWFESEYNAAKLAAQGSDEQDAGVATFERQAIEGKTGWGTYEWDGGTSYVAYGPLKEADWGFFVGFYGDSLETYARDVVSKGSGAAQIAVVLLVVVLGMVALVSVRSLYRQRLANDELIRRKEQIERQAEALAASEARFRVALERTGNIVFDFDIASGAIQCFTTPDDSLVCEATEENLRKSLVAGGVVERGSLALFCDALDDMSHGARRAECLMEVLGADGERLWYRASFSSLAVGDETPKRAIGVLENVTKEREAEYDSLTGLLDRKAAVEMVEAFLEEAEPAGRCAFVMLDVDLFKEVNDTCGHVQGDAVLRTVANILNETFGESAIVARYGGDEFCVFCRDAVSEAGLGAAFNQINERLAHVDSKSLCPVALSCSFGATVHECKGLSFEHLLKEADEALYAAKHAGRRTYVFYGKRADSQT